MSQLARKRELRKVEPPIIHGRPPPHDLAAEAAALEAMAFNPEHRAELLPMLRQEQFYADANGWIAEAVRELDATGRAVDLVAIVGWLRDRGRLEQAGGAAYVAEVLTMSPATRLPAQHARTIIEKWRMRRLISFCQQRAAEGYGDVGDVQEYLDDAEQELYELARTETGQEAAEVKTILRDVFSAMTAAAERGDRITGIATGYERLDAKTAGLHEGDLTIVAGRPGMGKTSLVLNIGVNVSAPPENGPLLGTYVFSLEMPREQLVTRMICSEARIDLGKMRAGHLQSDDWRRLTEAGGFLSQVPIWIDDTPAITLLELRAKVRRKQARFNHPAAAGKQERRLALVVVDYLQLMKGREGVSSREQEIGEISRGLKALAKELNVAIIALSQLNRAVETRSAKDKRPQLADLRESGAIEQDADNIIFIYRDEYYNPETTQAKGIAELIIAKQRNGPTGKVLTRFTSSCTRFDNLAVGDYPEMDE